MDCAHGVGHGVLYSALQRQHAWRTIDCATFPTETLDDRTLHVSRSLAIKSCLSAPTRHLASDCAFGVYDAVAEFLPHRIYEWMRLCPSTELAKVCFFSIMKGVPAKSHLLTIPTLFEPCRADLPACVYGVASNYFHRLEPNASHAAELPRAVARICAGFPSDDTVASARAVSYSCWTGALMGLLFFWSVDGHPLSTEQMSSFCRSMEPSTTGTPFGAEECMRTVTATLRSFTSFRAYVDDEFVLWGD
jgi:hypothetical protein